MVLVEAKVVDSTHLELSRPIAARQGLTVFVSVGEPGEKDAERQQWLAASASSLQTAYGESEPEYFSSMVRDTAAEHSEPTSNSPPSASSEASQD